MSGCTEAKTTSHEPQEPTTSNVLLEEDKNFYNEETSPIHDRLDYVDIYLIDGDIELLTRLGSCHDLNDGRSTINDHIHYQSVTNGNVYIGKTNQRNYDDIPECCQVYERVDDAPLKGDYMGELIPYLTYGEIDEILNNDFTEEDLIGIEERLQEQYDINKELIKKETLIHFNNQNRR